MLKKGIISTITAFVLSTSLSANPVTVSNDGLGDFLVAPVYLAKGEVCSEIVLMNTDIDSSVLLKVAFREHISSEEVDLPVLLSPGDVWDATVCQDNNGRVILTSNDDSNHRGTRAQLIAGIDLNLISNNAGHKNVDFSMGYIEVYPIAQYDEGSTAKVSKDYLADRWDKLIKGDKKSEPNLYPDGVQDYAISGFLSMKTDGLITTTLPLSSFKNVVEKVITGEAINYGISTNNLISSEKKNEIFKELQHNGISVPYYNYGDGQYLYLSFILDHGTQGQLRSFDVEVRDMEENKNEKKKVQVFISPKPLIPAIKPLAVHNEVGVISLKAIIDRMDNSEKFKKV